MHRVQAGLALDDGTAVVGQLEFIKDNGTLGIP